MENTQHIVIIGGGITGLSTAFYLFKSAEEQQLPIRITLLEAKSRIGGKIRTELFQGFVMEKGPDSFLERKISAKQLAIDLGIEDQLVRNQTGQAYILHQSRLHPIPEGSVMGVPTRLSPFISTRLFSPVGKMRAALDLLLPRQTLDKDVSVGSFFRHRLGNDVVDHLIEPLLSGIYGGNLDQLSLKATFPQFAQMEEKYRSLILAMKKSRSTNLPGKPKGQFLTLKNGLYAFVEAIEKKLPSNTIHRNSVVKAIEKTDKNYQIQLENGKPLTADAVIVTTPYPTLTQMLPSIDLPKPPNHTPATTVATVILGFDDQTEVETPYEGTGFVVPRTENTTITACTWTHKKWPHTTPDGKVLLRFYIGRPGNAAIVAESDSSILEHVQKDMAKVMNIRKQPSFYRITRWREANPQYTVGHTEWVKQLEVHLNSNLPGLFLAGAPYRGVGIPDCIDQGKRAVQEVLQFLNLKSTIHT
jgi:oxygen-dependent protoporphyrinogen oxidase